MVKKWKRVDQRWRALDQGVIPANQIILSRISSNDTTNPALTPPCGPVILAVIRRY